MQATITRRTALKTVGLGIGGVTLGTGVGAAATGPVELIDYDPAIGELPENIAVDKRGTRYVSFPPRGEIRAIPKGTLDERTVATFDIGSGQGVIGLEVHPNRTLYACLVTFDSAGSEEHGIWQVSPAGEVDLFAKLDPTTFPNDILLWGDSLLVTETIGGAVLRVGDGTVDEWVADPLLEGDGTAGFPFPLGANGIAEGRDGTVYVANTERGHIVEIPVGADGSPGTPSVFAQDPRLVAIDGLAIDTRDDLYAAIIGQDTVLRVGQDGTLETLADATDGLDGPSDVTFGTSKGAQRAIYITNFALLSGVDPSLMRLDVGVPGRPIHP